MSKKMLPIFILETLKYYSDQQHPLLQRDIIAYIDKNYNEKFERKAIASCIQELIDLGYDIAHDHGYYLDQRVFDPTEISYLIDVILNSPTLTKKQAHEMIRKLCKEESVYRQRSWHKIHVLSRIPYSQNPQFMLNVEMIQEAIEQNKKISFDYLHYGLDKRLHKKRDRKYIVNPYELIISMNKYYLVANYDKYENLSNYRIDKIANIEVLDEKRKPEPAPVEIPKYQLEHIYMFSGPSKNVKIKFKNSIIDQIIDWFSTDCVIEPIDEETSCLYAKVNERALYYWLKQYDEFAELITE